MYVAKWIVVVLMLLARPAFAGGGLDVKDWLSRPGVKLLAVEFYATWCSPCKEAVPKWKALHEKYRHQGLRLVVVSVQDPDGSCVNPGWNPDDVVCDAEGHLADAWALGGKLPAAFLWSWRGPLLVRKGHVEEVESQVKAELARLPRVTLDEDMDSSVRQMVRTELARTGKVEVIAGKEEEQALEDIRQTSRDLQFADLSSCKMGQRLAANSLLKSSFVKAGDGKRLLVQLFSAETGCLNASAGVYWNEEMPDMSIAEVVAELVNNLRATVDLPGGTAPRTIEERSFAQKSESWSMDVQAGVLVNFESDPAGAIVMVDGRLQCQTTPCSKTLSMGRHTVEMQKESYVPGKTSVSVRQGIPPVNVKLTPDFGWLSVTSLPSGLPVLVDGQKIATTPLSKHQISTGPHRVLVSDASYYDQGKQVQISRGESEVVEVTLQGREGGLVVHARDEQGNDLAAEVWLDEAKIGTTPLAQQVLIGQYKLRVVQNGRQAEQAVDVKEKQVAEIQAVLRRLSEFDAVLASPSEELVYVPIGRYLLTSSKRESKKTVRPFCIDRLEVSFNEYQECVDEEQCDSIQWSACLQLHESNGKKSRGTVTSRPLWHDDDHPVICVAPSEAEKYCRFKGGYLPSSAEWEAAARGRKGLQFPWGNDFPTSDLANGCANECEFSWGQKARYSDEFAYTAPVGSCPSGKSAFGVEDMSGNVWEWALLRAATPVARGGAWNSHTKDLTCSQEYANIDRETRWNSIGFRCAYPVQKCE